MKQSQESELLASIRRGRRPTIREVSQELIRIKRAVGVILEREHDPKERDRIALRHYRHAMLRERDELKAYLRTEEVRICEERRARATQ